MSDPTGQAHRLFVAYDLPDDTREHLARISREVAMRERWARPVAPERLHATILFIGQVPPAHLDRMFPALFDAMRGCERATQIVGLGARPTPQRARVIAAEYDDSNGQTRRLAHHLVRSVYDATGIELPLPGDFWPHITLARMSRPTHVRRFANPRGEHVFAFHRITLYDSYITSSGPRRYHALMTVPLDSHGERKLHHG